MWYFCPRRFKNRSPKWSLQTAGPYEIIRKINDVNYVIRLSPKHPGFTVHVDRLREYKMADERNISGPIDVAPFPAPKKSKPLVSRNIEISHKSKPLVSRNIEISHDPRSQRDRKAPRRLIADM